MPLPSRWRHQLSATPLVDAAWPLPSQFRRIITNILVQISHQMLQIQRRWVVQGGGEQKGQKGQGFAWAEASFLPFYWLINAATWSKMALTIIVSIMRCVCVQNEIQKKWFDCARIGSWWKPIRKPFPSIDWIAVDLKSIGAVPLVRLVFSAGFCPLRLHWAHLVRCYRHPRRNAT